MCLAVYLATDRELRDVPTDAASADRAYFAAVEGNDAVRNQFSLPFVYYVGSHEGCGCGFFKRGSHGEELERCQENYRVLAAAVRDALAVGRAEVFAAWEGDQGEAPEYIDIITPGQFEAADFELKKKQFLRFVADDG